MPNIDDLQPVSERRRGYATALAEHDIYPLEPWKISPPGRHEFHETDIYSLVGSQSRRIIQQVESFTDAAGPMPTAVVCVNDILAIIAISALRNMGYAVPGDVSVVGFDDISMASHIGVPLTTASQDAYELGKVASQMLLERLGGDESAPRHYTVPTPLRVRASTAAPMIGVEGSGRAIAKGGRYRRNERTSVLETLGAADAPVVLTGMTNRIRSWRTHTHSISCRSTTHESKNHSARSSRRHRRVL